MIVETVRTSHPNRCGLSIDDFYYRGYSKQLGTKKGTGVRDLARRMIDEGKILNRYVFLQNPDLLVSITIFRDKPSYEEWRESPEIAAAGELWKDREWDVFVEVCQPVEFLDVKEMLWD